MPTLACCKQLSSVNGELRAVSLARHQIRPTGRRPPDRESGPDGTCCSPVATQHTMHARRSVHDWITTTRSDSGGGEGASDDDETRDRYHDTHGRGTWVTHVYVEPNPGEIRTGWKPPQGCGNVTTSRRNVPGRAAGAILVHRAGK
jgi:hypothetical protein